MKRAGRLVMTGALMGAVLGTLPPISAQSMTMPGMSPPAGSRPATKPTIKLVQGWVAAAPPGAGELSAYIELQNSGPAPLMLTGLSSSVSGQAMLMNTGTDSAGRETMQMAGGWRVPAGGRLKVLPGHGHLMLRQLRRQPQPGEAVAVKLRFSDGSVLPVTLPVRRWP